MRQWAIAIGINQYQHFQPLTCAQHDAQSLCEGLIQTGAIARERCFLLTDTSPMIAGRLSQPNRQNIEALWTLLCQQLAPEDGVWVFFSGYGVCHQGQDYLMPSDGDPTAIATSGIAVSKILQDMASSAAEFTLVLLDINRSQSVIDQERVGMATAQAASDVGMATVLSCQPSQFSQEASGLGQGLFTMAVLEGLRGNRYRTLVELHQFLRDRLPELGDHHERPQQNPFTICPPYRIHQVILPQLIDKEPSFERSSAALHAQLLPPHGSEAEALRNPADGSGAEGAIPAWETVPKLGKEDADQLGTPGASRAWAATPFAPVASSASLPEQPEPDKTSHSVDQNSGPPKTLEGEFWPWMWRWGSLALVLLIAGSLVQTCAPLFRKQVPPTVPEQRGQMPKNLVPSALNPTMPQASAKTLTPMLRSPPSAPSPDSAPVQNSEPVPDIAPAPSRLALARTKILIKSDQASHYAVAIQTAKNIPRNHPDYGQAQRDIGRWSQEIYAIAQRRAGRAQFNHAILAAALVPRNQAVYGAARGAIPTWCANREITTSESIQSQATIQKRIERLCASQAP